MTGSVSGAANRERTTGGTPARPTGSISAAPERARVTGSVSKSAPSFDRERVTAPLRLQQTKGTAPGVNRSAPTGPKQLTEHQKTMLGSTFQDSKRMDALKAVVGTTAERKVEEDDDEPTALGPLYDGVTAARELTGRDLWKAVQAPVQSREGRRSKTVYRQVINQFAVGHNPRYQPDGPDKSRGHIFIWDVSRAMNTEIPHFIGAKEFSLGQTADWLRHEGPTRGWTRANPQDAAQVALQGMLVVAMPKEIRMKQLALVLPEPADKDGRPRLAGASVKVGNNLSVYEALGVYAADYFFHV